MGDSRPKVIYSNWTKFKSYEDYLKSTHWKKLRKKILYGFYGGNKPKCCLCGLKENLHVHHLVYPKNLEKPDKNMLKIVCKSCHYWIHLMVRNGKLIYKSDNPIYRYGQIQSLYSKLKITG